MNSENGLNGDMRILLADDHDMVRDTISAYLSSVVQARFWYMYRTSMKEGKEGTNTGISWHRS